MVLVTKKITNFAFVLFLFVPLVVCILLPTSEVSLSEKRKLAPFPALESLSLKTFTKQFESYWNDHFGFRGALIGINTTLQTKIFKKSPVRMVIKGNEGWLYFNIRSITLDFLGLSLPNKSDLEMWANNVKERDAWLTENNIHYVLLPVPSKMHIYPEYLPYRYSFFRQGDGKTSLDLILEYLNKKENSFKLLSLKNIYLKEKQTDQLYHKTDTHWTYRGAYLAYLEIMRKIQTWYPEIKPIEDTNMRSKRYKLRGDLAIMMGGRKVSSEESLKYIINESCTGDMYKLPNHDPKTTQRHPMVTHCDTGKLTAVIVSDSFGSKLTPFLAQHFKKTIYVSMRDFVWLKEFLPKEKPDLFIHEQAARQLSGMLQDTWNLKGRNEL